MASANASLNVNLKNHIDETNSGIQKMLSSRSIPLWINPNNGNFYNANPYKAGDIVILLSDENEIYYLLRYYFENISENLGVSTDFFVEKNNPELKNNVIDSLLHGGYIIEDKYINPMTVISTSEKGYGLYVSLKNQNYDIPGSSDSWFNLDMSESLDSTDLQISRIISILTSDGYLDSLKEPYQDPITGKQFNNAQSGEYIDNRLDAHKANYHFGEGLQNDDVINADDALNKILAEIESQMRTTTSVMRNPFVLNNEIIGNTLTITQTTGQMFFYCILDTTKLEKNKNITIQFTPSNVSNIIVPFVLQTSNGLLTVDNPETDECVLTESGQYAWYANSFVSISNDINASNNITLQIEGGFEDANFNNNFRGFLDDAYIASYTPIGAEIRTENIAIHCSPVKEISRTNKSLTFQLTSDYVWKYNAIAIALNGKCEVNT